MIIGNFDDFKNYCEEILGRPVSRRAMLNMETVKEIKDKSKQDFLDIKITEN